MKRFFIITVVLFYILSYSESFWACEIDGKLTPELAKYTRDTDVQLAKLSENTTNQCWSKAWSAITWINKSIELTDRALLQIPVTWDIMTDFEYNILMTFRWESRTAVTVNGETFAKIQTKISRTIDSLTRSCNLTEEKKILLTEMIRINHILESTYKTTAAGWKANRKGEIPSPYHALYDEITNKYTPSATSSCKNQFDFEKSMSDAMNSFSKGTFGIENAYDNWYEAIALFSGKSRSWLYKDTQRRLLIQYLSTQWLSKNSKDIILKKFDCVKSKETWDQNAEETVKAIADCSTIQVSWLDKVKEAAQEMLKEAKNTEQYVEQTLKGRETIYTMTEISTIYEKYKGESTPQESLNDTMLASLVNLHIQLLSINKILDTRIPVMQKNCMKTLRWVVGWCKG
jgi:hypothetical protein